MVLAAPFWLAATALGAVAPSPAPAAPNVILVTLDGVRWEEFFSNRPDPGLSDTDRASIFPYFWREMAPRGVVYGDLAKGSLMTVANQMMMSLPGYVSMFAGSTQLCYSNDCGRIGTETLQERIRRELKIGREDVASFASWPQIAFAVEHKAGTTWVDAGQGNLGPNGLPSSARQDSVTFSRALAYLRAHRPRFLYIALVESDEMGHKRDYPGYLAILRRYDAWLRDLVLALGSMGAYGRNTTLIVTTDHGRGEGPQWIDHARRGHARRVWLFAMGPKTNPVGVLGKTRPHSHLNIRPTVEALLGLCPKDCMGCKLPLPEVWPGNPEKLCRK